MLSRQFEGVEGGVDHTNLSALRLRVEEGALSPRNPQHVPKGRKDDVSLLCDKSRVVDAAHRDHADRASGTMDEGQALGQIVLDAVLVDRVRVASADLHHLISTRSQTCGDFLGEALREVARSVLVYEAHEGIPVSSSMPCVSSKRTW